MAKTEIPKPIDYDSIIDDFIQKIDNEKSLFTWRVELPVYGMTLYIVGLSLFLVLGINYLPNSFIASTNRITVSIALVAVLLTYVSYTSKGIENNVVNANFWKAIKEFKIEEKEEEKRLLLRALLKMKATNEHYKLGIAKKMYKEMFTKEKLLERLYEQPK
jgi:hypothetical protein